MLPLHVQSYNNLLDWAKSLDCDKIHVCMLFFRKNLFFNHYLSEVCPQCRQRDTLTLSPLPGSIILVNQKGNILPENGYSCLIQTALVIHMHN